MNGSEILYYWLIFSVLIVLFCGVVIFLAHRAGYLRDQDRARYLALWAEISDEGRSETGKCMDIVTENALSLPEVKRLGNYSEKTGEIPGKPE